MASAFYNFSFFQNHDCLRISYCRQPVCNHKNRPSLHNRIHPLFDQTFCSCVDRTGCFIQNQDGRLRYRCPCNGEKLPLSPGERLFPVTVEHCIISVRQPAYKRIRIGNLSRFAYLIVRSVQLSITDIFCDCAP